MPKRVWTPEQVISEIQELNRNGVDLRHGAVQETCKRLVSAAIRYYGSWRAAVEAAGVDYDQLRKVSEEQRLQKIGKWSSERILEEIRSLVAKGEDMRAVIVKNKYPALFSAAVSPRYFANWREALTAAGGDYEKILSDSPRGRPKRTDIWHADLILEKIREMRGSGLALDAETISEKFPRLMRLATVRFGSWHSAVTLALEHRQDSGGHN